MVEETTDAPGLDQGNEGLRLKGAAIFDEAEDMWQDLQEHSRA
jgi:hypothetical protein